MAIIFNSEENGITKEQMQDLYRNNLILCDDHTFTVATIPDWATNEVKSMVDKEIKGITWDCHKEIKLKEDVAKHNSYRYPKLYRQTCIQPAAGRKDTNVKTKPSAHHM